MTNNIKNSAINSGDTSLSKLLNEFDTLTLDELGEALLQKRFDTKYIIPQEQLTFILPKLTTDFRVLEIDGLREFHYSTQYYDAPDYRLYYKHHNGVQNRKKLRYRTYLDSNISFLEVKHKINGSFIKKIRIPIEILKNNFNDTSKEFIASNLCIKPDILVPKLKTKFNRITLQHKFSEEKITIDRNIYFKNTIRDYTLKGLAVIEVKQTHLDHSNGMIKLLRDMSNLHPISFSKYCIGLVITDRNVKYNNFKNTLLFMKKFTGDNYEF